MGKKRVVQIIRKKDLEKKEYVSGLLLELDYELATLHDSMQSGDLDQSKKSKKRLGELHKELVAFKAI